MTSRSQEHHIAVSRTARYWTLGNGRDPSEVWFVIHGYKQLARRFLRRFASIDDDTRLIVAPEALSRFYIGQEAGRHGATSVVGATWMTREDREHEIGDYVSYLDRLAEEVCTPLVGPRPRVVVLGFSQGVATSTRWVVRGKVCPAQLVLWGDVTPPDLDMTRASEALAEVDVVMVRGDQDPALGGRLAAEESTRLATASIGYRTLSYGGGHDIDEGALAELVR